MTSKLLRILACATVSADLAGCAMGGSPPGPPAAQSLDAATYPPGAYGALRAQVLPFVHPLRGSASYNAQAGSLLVYVSNFGANAVEVFHQGGRAQQPVATITKGLAYPSGLATDHAGNLYVADSGEYDGGYVVQRFARGATSPGKTYTTDLSEPSGVAVAKDGTIYIANYNQGSNGWVAVYPKGDTSKEYRLWDFGGGAPVSTALDAKQNLYVMYGIGTSGGSSAVNEYKPAAKTGKNLDLNFAYGAGIQVDSAGNLLVVQQVRPSEVLVFPPGNTQSSKSITLPNGGEPYGLALNRGGKLLFAGDAIGNIVDRFAYPSGKFQYPLAGGFADPAGFATAPSEF